MTVAAALVLVTVAAAPVWADGPFVTTIDGETVPGAPASIDELHLSMGEGKSFELSRIRRIDYGRPVVEPAKDVATVRIDLANGDRIFGRITGSDERLAYLYVESASAGRLALPYQRIDLLVFRVNLLAEAIPERAEGSVEDVLYAVKAGARMPMPGVVKTFSEDKVHFYWKTADKDGDVPYSKLESIRFRLGAEPAAPTGVVARFHLVDGTVLSCVEPKLADGSYRAKMIEGGEIVSIPEGGVARVDLTSDLVLFLSDETPEEVKEYDFHGDAPIYAYERDRTAAQKPIQLAGKTYDKGLGVHAYSSLTYNLRRRYKMFRTLAALDAVQAGDRGCVFFRVYGDERVLFESEAVRSATAPLPIEVDVSGVRFLRLEVDFGPPGDHETGDHAVWASPMVTQ